MTIACDGQRRWEFYSDKIITGAAEPLRRDIRDLADPPWLLRYWLSGGPAGNRPAYRINAGRRQGDRPSADGTANPSQRGTRRAARLRLQSANCVITVGYLRKGRQVARIRSGADQRPNRITSEVRSVARPHRR